MHSGMLVDMLGSFPDFMVMMKRINGKNFIYILVESTRSKYTAVHIIRVGQAKNEVII